MSSSQLTNSIIFQRDGPGPPSSYKKNLWGQSRANNPVDHPSHWSFFVVRISHTGWTSTLKYFDGVHNAPITWDPYKVYIQLYIYNIKCIRTCTYIYIYIYRCIHTYMYIPHSLGWTALVEIIDFGGFVYGQHVRETPVTWWNQGYFGVLSNGTFREGRACPWIPEDSEALP